MESKHSRSKRLKKEAIDAIKLASGCVDCGYNSHAEALDFDHRPDETKVACVSKLKLSASWDRVLEEMAKCDIVCANCHRVRSHARRK